MDDEQNEIEHRAFRRGEESARAKRLEEEHAEVLLFVRKHQEILGKLYASKMTETIVNTVLKVVFLAVLGAGLALVIIKR